MENPPVLSEWSLSLVKLALRQHFQVTIEQLEPGAAPGQLEHDGTAHTARTVELCGHVN